MRLTTVLLAALAIGGALLPSPTASQGAPRITASPASPFAAELDRRIAAVMPKVVAWRRDFHQHPELSGEEARTSKIVAEHLRALGIETTTGVGGHGVVGVLRGGKPGQTVALRADMDALPVEELVDLPFKSKVRGTYRGQSVGIMHACGHDNHIAILMGTAEVLAAMKANIPGTIKFIFQPAEEGLENSKSGAHLMIRDGVLDNPKVDAIFGLHVGPNKVGQITYRAGPAMAASNSMTITVNGRQTHGEQPWAGVDPIVIGAQIVTGLQTLVSRQINITSVPAIVTIGSFQGGVRNNIIPDSVVMLGTIRTFDRAIRDDMFKRITRTAEMIAASAGATARVVIDSGNPVTRNDSALTVRMIPTLERAAGAAGATVAPLVTASEDFSAFQERIPGLFFNLGGTPRDRDPATAPANHSPSFFVDEAALPIGVRALSNLAMDYLTGAGGPRRP